MHPSCYRTAVAEMVVFNPLKLKLVQITFNNSIHTSKKTLQHTKDQLVREIIAVYSENHTKPINTLCGQNLKLLVVEARGTFIYHSDSKG
jgi:hypothetical protein